MKSRKLSLVSSSEKKTIAIGRTLSRFLKKGDTVALCGDLGSGKTTFVKGLAQGLEIRQKINSPSFVILKLYKGKKILQHFDLYRMNSVEEIEGIGFEEFLLDDAISVIEWADKVESLLPQEYLRINILTQVNNKRILKFTSFGLRYNLILSKLKNISSKC